jgi:hypothetical protein
MFILKDKTQLERAIEKAKQIRPKVHFVKFGRYQVSGSKGGFYTVQCCKDERGIKAVACTCKAGDRGLVCFHSVAALSLHIGLARLRQNA